MHQHSNPELVHKQNKKIPWTYSSVETLRELSELRQRVAEQHVRMGAVEQNADDCLGGTGVVNDLKTHR